MGEVFEGDVPFVVQNYIQGLRSLLTLHRRGAAQYQGPGALDSILQYPVYDGLVQALTIPGPLNMSALVDVVGQSQEMFNDTTVLGNFLENQDVPRWGNLSVDPQSL